MEWFINNTPENFLSLSQSKSWRSAKRMNIWNIFHQKIKERWRLFLYEMNFSVGEDTKTQSFISMNGFHKNREKKILWPKDYLYCFSLKCDKIELFWSRWRLGMINESHAKAKRFPCFYTEYRSEMENFIIFINENSSL